MVLADRPGTGRKALTELVSRTPGVALVAQPSVPEEIAAALRETKPDVLVIDDRLLANPAWARLDTRLIVVGVDDDPGFVARARRLGAEAWIPKDRADALLPIMLTD